MITTTITFTRWDEHAYAFVRVPLVGSQQFVPVEDEHGREIGWRLLVGPLWRTITRRKRSRLRRAYNLSRRTGRKFMGGPAQRRAIARAHWPNLIHDPKDIWSFARWARTRRNA